MKLTSRYLLLIVVVIVVPVAIVGVLVIVENSKHRIVRDGEYRELIGEFQRAIPRNRINPDDKNSGWEFHVQIPETQNTVLVKAPAHPGVVRIQYGDEIGERPLYKYVDYSHPKEIKTSENILYVYWVEMFFYDDHWLIAYDMANRREIARRLLDPSDLRQVQ